MICTQKAHKQRKVIFFFLKKPWCCVATYAFHGLKKFQNNFASFSPTVRIKNFIRENLFHFSIFIFFFYFFPPEGWFLVWPINFKNVLSCLVSVWCLSAKPTRFFQCVFETFCQFFQFCENFGNKKHYFWTKFSIFWKILVTKYVIFDQHFQYFGEILVTKYTIFEQNFQFFGKFW